MLPDLPDHDFSPCESPDTSDTTDTTTETSLVPVAARQDGWTPARQRDFLEALADSGCVSAAAHAVGMSTQSAYRLRRRADARAFDAAWEAALERAMQRLVPVALDRAINGTVRQRWYRGEMIAEERVYSDRLLIHLMTHGARMLSHADARRAIAADWSAVLEGIASGDPTAPAFELSPDPEFTVQWIEGDYYRTNCPPPPGYDGPLVGRPGDKDFLRYLDDQEREAWLGRGSAITPAQEAQRRRFFGLDRPGAPPPRPPRPVFGRRKARKRTARPGGAES